MSGGIRRWTSVSTGVAGLEVACEPLQPYALAEALGGLDRDSCDGFAFLIVRLVSADRSGARAVVGALRHFSNRLRTCLAVDIAALEMLDFAWLDRQGVGLLLDGVSAETPPAALARDAVEGVRFSDAFFTAASRNLRMCAVLQSTLGLTRELGLVTFSAPSYAGVLPPAAAPLIDYVPGDRQPLDDHSTVEASFSQRRGLIKV